MLAERHISGPVFCDTDGHWLRKSNFQRRSFDRALKRAGLIAERKAAGKPKPRFHDLRHTCATNLLLQDVNAKIVSERLGHAKIEITLNIYSHVLPTLQARAAEKLEVVMRRMVAGGATEPGSAATPANAGIVWLQNGYRNESLQSADLA
jgi:integrase